MNKITQITMCILALGATLATANENINAANAYINALENIKNKAYLYTTVAENKSQAYKELKIAYKDTIAKANSFINIMDKTTQSNDKTTLETIESIKKFTTEVAQIVRSEKLVKKAMKRYMLYMWLDYVEQELKGLDDMKTTLKKTAQDSIVTTQKYIIKLKTQTK